MLKLENSAVAVLGVWLFWTTATPSALAAEGNSPFPVRVSADGGVARGPFEDGYDRYGLRGDPDFDPSAPTLKDGTPVTGEMAVYYRAFLRAFLSDAGPMAVRRVFGYRDLYAQARNGQIVQESAMAVFRLTGDLRILDRLLEGYDELDRNMVVGWSGHDCSLINPRPQNFCCGGALGVPWGPHRSLLWLANRSDWRYGTNVHDFDDLKSRAIMAEFAWALHVNRGQPSPGGRDYAAEADRWGTALEEWLYAWSADIDECWVQNYRGVRPGPWHTSPTEQRARWSTWPARYHSGGHKSYNSVYLQRYLGLLGQTGLWRIPEPVRAVEAAGEIAEHIARHWVPCVSSRGQPAIISRGNQNPGGIRYDEPLRATYTAYAAWSLIGMYLSGAFPDVFSRENLLRLARAYADMVNADGSTNRLLGGEVDRCAHGLNLGAGAARTPSDNANRGLSAMLVFADETEAGGTHLFASATSAQMSRGGGYDELSAFVLPAAQFVRRALEAVGGL